MSKLFLASSLLCALAGVIIVPSSGCSSRGAADEPLGTATEALFDDGGPTVARGVIVISQVYGAGGFAAAPGRNNDYVELFNKSTKDVSLDTLSIQVATATAEFGATPGDIFALSGTIKASQFYLIKLESAGGSGGEPIVEDVAAPTLALGKTDGKVALALATTALACGTSTTPCPASKVLDIVGYGSVNGHEGSASVGALDPMKAAIRKGGGGGACVDTENNKADFDVAAPNPRNSTAAKAPCPVSVPDAGVDAGREAGPPTPAVVDPDLGEESPFDAGSRREAGAPTVAPAAEEGCTIARGHKTGTSGILGVLVALGLALAARRRK